MLLSCAIALSLAAPAPTVADFSGLTPGSVRVYDSREGSRTGESTEEIGQPVKVGGKTLVPITTKAEGVIGSRLYYAVEGDALSVMAVSESQLLQNPAQILKVGTGVVRWQYRQLSPVAAEATAMTVSAESSLKGKRRVLGKECEVVEVKYSAESAPGEVPFKLRQTALYAAGIGLIELESDWTVAKNASHSKKTIKRYIPPR